MFSWFKQFGQAVPSENMLQVKTGVIGNKYR